ncbi:zinc ABC transporter substrate-binding protein [Kribbella sandramycini]|uniref:Zinc ABC transporter substrate-binding protein n=1 Tax=Kribbella sandramycini TaxID=60450 RepID=A0A7Y4NWX8_9ACTN|nr:metal ABC transporter substrate-binding protein [Kribbella sandramycini]MBB6568119.1 zinc transport system substrate-binding protein [Kribbella sandramycini]NOL39287.1 zinc ABC transporter substrate-binding protein [Kribbella sandramycini]
MRSCTRAVVAGVAALAAITLAGCGGSSAGGSGGDKLDVVTSFYPLEFIARTVGGDAVNVTTLTAPGVEPHDLELTPKQVGEIAQAKVVVYEKSLQPAVDEAVEQNAKETGFDVAPAAELEATGANFEEHEEGEAEAAGHSDEALDPHFWLDPVRYTKVVNAITDKLVAADSANADGYKARAKTLLDEVGKLDSEFRTGLANCKLKTFVTSHEAFAYLAKRYGLTMVGIAGFTPDAEPTPTRIKEVQEIVKAQHVTTIFSEELVSPKVAETIAKDVGVKTAVLSPIEGLSDANSQETYLSLMRENLQELRKANSCT